MARSSSSPSYICFAALASLAAAPPVFAEEPVATVVLSGTTDNPFVEQALRQPGGRTAAAQSRLSVDVVLSEQRNRAAALLARARRMVEDMQYDEALRLLESAESSALRGLARVVQPRLLSSIYLQRGVALLPTDRVAARRHLVQSFLHWPDRPLDDDLFSPKVLADLKQAAREARQQSVPEIALAEARLAASTLRAPRLLLATPHRCDGAKAGVTLVLYEASHHRWSRITRASWPCGAALEQIQVALTPHLGVLAEPAVVRPARWPVWTAAVACGTTLVAGVVLAAMARSRQQEAEFHAQQTPLVFYQPTVSEIEQSGRRMQVASITMFSISAAAAVVTAALALWPRRPKTVSSTASIGAGIGELQLVLRFR